jgi:anti-sigma-K factor RskA
MTDELNALAGAYALDALNDDERAVFEQHLQECADCAEEVLGLQNAVAELSFVEATPPPPQLRADVLSAITRVRPLPPTGNVISITRSRRARWAPQLLAAACMLIAVVAAGWGIQQHQQANRSDSHVSALNAAIAAPDSKAVTADLGSASGVSATVVYSKVHGTLLLNARGISTLAADKTYQAWTMTAGGAATSLGTFKPDSAGNVTLLAKSDLSAAAFVGITVEPAGGSKTPTGQAEAIKL